MKDNFSQQAADYAQFRPLYPSSCYDFLLKHVENRSCAWDCGTGNGQVANIFADSFDHVFATDISEKQLHHAVKRPNIAYSLCPAESTDFPDQFFDLIVVAQAIHWFNFDQFYAEVRRTLKPDGLFVVMGYGVFSCAEPLNSLVQHFYTEVIGKYWDSERRYIDEQYQTIPFPFHEIPVPPFEMQTQWAFENLIGYFNTWSAVQHYRKQEGHDPVEQWQESFREAWGTDKVKPISFPLLLRIGTL
jgi:ubiquinone/menaquinone biosynthesis C-methylase UbiE